MKTTIRQIGSSKGIIIPANLIKQYQFGDEVDLTADEKGIYLSPIKKIREGWAESAKSISKSKDDHLLIPDHFKDEEMANWTW